MPLGLISSSTRRMLDHGVARQRWRPHATRIADRALSSRASLSQSQRSATLRQRGEVPESKIQVCRMRLQNADCRSGRSSQFCNRRAMGYYNVTHACGAAAAVCSRILESGFWWSECRPPLRNTDTKCWTPGFWHAQICTFTPPECGPALQNADFQNTTHDCRVPHMARDGAGQVWRGASASGAEAGACRGAATTSTRSDSAAAAIVAA